MGLEVTTCVFERLKCTLFVGGSIADGVCACLFASASLTSCYVGKDDGCKKSGNVVPLTEPLEMGSLTTHTVTHIID